MSDQRGGRGRGRGGSGSGAPRGSSAGRGQSGSRGGSPAGDRGGFRGGRGGGDYQGGRGGGSAMPVRSGPPPGRGGIYLDGKSVPAPNPAITTAENELVLVTRDKNFDGFPGRRGYGTKGMPIVLRTNYFVVTPTYELGEAERPIYAYTLKFGNTGGQQETTASKEQKDLSRGLKRALTATLLKNEAFAGKSVATDYATWIITAEKLAADLELKITPDSTNATPKPQDQGPAPDFVVQARARNTHLVKVSYHDTFSLREMVQYLQSRSAGAEYAGRTDLLQFLNIIMCKGPNLLDNVVAIGKGQFFPNQIHPAAEPFELGGGLQALRGYFASVRPAVNRLLINLNVTSGAFYKPILLTHLLDSFPGSHEQKEGFIRTLKVEARYTKDGAQTPFQTRIKTILGFAKPDKNIKVERFGSANQVRFKYQDRNVTPPREREVTVNQYYKQHHGITLRDPGRPVLVTGTRTDPQYLPAELCMVLPGQPYRRLLGADQTSNMITFAARTPNLNAVSIAGDGTNTGVGQRVFRIDTEERQSVSIKHFGFGVATQMLTVPGRILASPRVTYGVKNLDPFNGSWNCAGQKFMKPAKFNAWSTLVINREGPRGKALFQDADPTIDELARNLKEYGIDMGRRMPKLEITIRPSRDSTDKQVKEVLEKVAKHNVAVLLVIIPEVDRWLYGRIKYYGDVEYGVHTICSVGKKIEKTNGQGMYMGNLALKFNIKGGGINHKVANPLTAPLDNNTMLVGIDVTHPSPGSTEGAPSVACVVASVDEHLQQWPGSVRPQTGRVEMVEELKDMVVERLRLWQRKHGKYPTKIVLYRDGVSEGQYSLVLEHELPSFEKAFVQLYGAQAKWPKMSIIVVGKRHHTRFYPTDVRHADYNAQRDKGSWNPKPGTIVDRHIGGKVLREFWLQAHQGLQGTAKPAHYVVIKDDIKFEADQMEQFTHNLCYLFNRATKAVSVCPPAYYADLLCERARYYLFSTLQEDHGSSIGGFDPAAEWKGNVHMKLAESTWYI